ncbi:hypothetical protein [Nitrosomonas sp. ANs5]|uniref:hypothetical protein n=1 Tax=Nitrosomonas sp. ANs5 TaxID=3423941 RepID=UPI003D356F81
MSDESRSPIWAQVFQVSLKSSLCMASSQAMVNRPQSRERLTVAPSFRLDNLSTNAAWQAENNLENTCRL